MRKILIVDDEKRIRRVYSSLLKGEGFKVSAVSNAVDANEIIKTEKIDLVLLDIKMPEIDGSAIYEVVRLLHKRVKVIIASVYPLDEQKEIIEKADDYYDKSQGVDILLEKVKKVLRNGKNKKKIVIIDDESGIRSLFTRQLKEAGYRSIGVGTGEEAFKLFRREKSIALVILDIFIPHSNGIDAFETIKREFPHLKVIIASVYPKHEQQLLIWDADDYYYKAEGMPALIDKVDRLIGL